MNTRRAIVISVLVVAVTVGGGVLYLLSLSRGAASRDASDFGVLLGLVDTAVLGGVWIAWAHQRRKSWETRADEE